MHVLEELRYDRLPYVVTQLRQVFLMGASHLRHASLVRLGQRLGEVVIARHTLRERVLVHRDLHHVFTYNQSKTSLHIIYMTSQKNF